MKVLEAKPWVFVFHCKGCNSKLEAESDDVLIGSFGSMGDYESHPYVACPICESDHLIPWSKLIPKVEALAKSKSK